MSTATRRGRPRKYDPDVAVEQARDVFWRNGYAATSLEEVGAAMGMNRPSIYAGFGDKRAVYVAAVERYAADSRASLAEQLARPRPLRDTLRAVYRRARKFYQAGDDEARGCFLVGTAVTEARRDEQVRAIVDATFDAFTDLFAERFEAAVQDGELSTAANPRALAHMAAAALNNLAMRTRTGATPEVLDDLIDAAVDLLCPTQVQGAD